MRSRTIHDEVDALVIGAGCAGAIVSQVLAEAGVRVTCLEQGHWWQASDYPHDRADWEWRRLTDWNTAVNVRKQAQDYPIDTGDEMTLMWSGVGGSTTIYTATWPRFRPSDFRKGREHGLAPDWPIAYEDLAPHYEATDRLVGVSGVQGDPAMPLRGPFQTRPLPQSALGRVAAKGFRKLVWHHWPTPCAILAEDFDGRPACNNCGNCQSGCPRGSLNSVDITIWPKALAAGAELRTHARVEMIETDRQGRATGAVYVDRNTGVRHFQPADRVILACNGVGTPRLLLLSAGGRHPDGLANASDQVGRNLMHHVLSIVEMWTDQRLDSHKGIISSALICEEFAETDEARGFVNGFTIQIARLNGAGYQALGSHSGHVCPWGEGHHEHFRTHFSHGLCATITGDDLPQANNRVTLSDSIVDSSGLPAPNIDYKLHDNDKKLIRFGIDRAVDLAGSIDAFDHRINDFGLGSTGYCPPAWHLLGTCRMGDDRETSVTDKWHRAWECPNLYIVDGSSMVTGAAVNPTSTISALAHRAAEAMLIKPT
ncbi:MAG: GMC family oxidoreductase [Pseudomonadota bacterium]